MAKERPPAAVDRAGAVYLVAGSRPWSRRAFEHRLRKLPGRWHLVSEPNQLTPEAVAELAPDTLFFLHWSWVVPTEILDRHRCIGFHMTDLPYGRGGSPLQNLIQRGVRETVLTAFRMTGELDAGPVYLKEPLSLEGGAEEIYLRSSQLAERPRPRPQRGVATHFRRRRPSQSEIGEPSSLEELFDLIRMLDAEGYPHAYLDRGSLRLSFRRAALYDGRIEASVTITEREGS